MGLKAGDTVRLKSGGPAMTVKRVADNGNVVCEWFNRNDGNFEHKWHEFVQTSLETIE
ncbi:YodC family protein [Agrobacterium pusense]|uniref:YodC family protein n=1 Tax=Agrobacterium pusense TaxID=648995 RepID=UPI0028A74C7B|nr:DUF2158 domain-containing protein [Agrobacterium pusense]